MSNQGLRHAAVRAATGTALTYDGDWHALFDAAAIPAGDFNGRMLAWINGRLGSSYAEIDGAMSAYAVSQGFPSWSEMGTFTPGGGIVTGKILLEDGVSFLMMEDGVSYILMEH